MPELPQTTAEMFTSLQARFGATLPEAELRRKAAIAVEINRLKKQKNAVILGHNYMDPVLYYSVADITGDSLELSRQAAAAEQEIIVFCGVKFMAETAKILNPAKTVLLPADAGCSLAASITAADVRALKARYPGVPVVTYINTYADVKAETDICCTSGNAAAVIKSLPGDTVIFLPDEYLAGNIARQTGKRIIFPNLEAGAAADPSDRGPGLIGWGGRCEVHEKFTLADIRTIQARHPGALILTHPEASPEVAAAADFAGSTVAMIQFVEDTPAPGFVILTETAIGANIAAANPGKNILLEYSQRCPHMNLITLENTLESLQTGRIEITVPEEIRVRALRAVERMIAIR